MSLLRLTNNQTLNILTMVYILVLLFSAVAPYSFEVWILEIVPAIFVLAMIWMISSHITFSHTAYGLMFVWLILHTIGAKYSFSEVPFTWFNHLVESNRNNFDRVTHFSIGFFAYPIAEYMVRRNIVTYRIACVFGLFSIMSVACGYEIIKWWLTDIAGQDEHLGFLSTNGDVWNAQKEMLCDTSGALFVLTGLYIQCIINPKRFKTKASTNIPPSRIMYPH